MPSTGGSGRGGIGVRLAAAAVAALLAPAAGSAEPGAVVAARTSRQVHVDGRLDDEAWREAPAFGAFVESFPRPGVPASLPTEVRVLYDDETLYVGVTCHDPEPAAIVRQLARRDTETAGSDRVEIAIASGSGLAAYDFTVNAAGVLRDQLLYADVNSTDSWDAVWEGAADVGAEGWSAELAIPFRQLRFSAAREQRWRIVVRRHVPRTHQVLDSALVPRDANPITAGALVVSRFGRLEGLVDLRPRRAFELLPYLASRATARPQFSDPRRPDPRLVDPAVDVGLDFKTALSRRLTLTGAVNPDFGQVESDAVIQNLSNAEQLFPEKRPFFLEGLDVFQPVGAEYGSQQQLFYSRRIGLSAPILGAAKVTGAARDGLEVGVLDSLVTGAGDTSPDESDPDRRWRFHLRQPLHLGPQSALPPAAPLTTNYFAAVARQRLSAGGATAGATFAAATPLEPRCRRAFATEADLDAAGCGGAHGANALALDLNVPGTWGGFAQVSASQAVGGPEEGRLLRDGTRLRAGDLGFGGHMRAGKLGGEPWRFDVLYVYEDRTLDLNGVGFQPLSDYQWADLDLHYVRPSGLGPFHSFQIDYNLDLNWDAAGTLARGVNSNVQWKVQLPGYETIGTKIGLEIPQYDTREIPGARVPFERMADGFVSLILGTDPSRRLQASGDVFLIRTFRTGPFEPRWGWGWDLAASWRPHDRLETRLDGAYGYKPQGPRWIETRDGAAVFGNEVPEFISLTLRQQVVFTPRLTAQLYAQLFTQAVRFDGSLWSAQLAGRRALRPSDLAPFTQTAARELASHDGVLNVNAVVRWEYRLGSALFLVYTRSQGELPAATGRPPPSGIGSPRLLRGATVETALVKWSWWWDGA